MAGADRWAHRRAEPRMFAAMWTFYLFVASVVSVGAAGVMGLVATDVYRPAARILVVITGAGVGVVWPLIRLSQAPPRRALRAAVVDAIVVIMPVQAMVWPQGLDWMAAWPWSAVGTLAGVFAAWIVLVSALLALYFERLEAMGVARWGAMLGFVLLAGIGPGVSLLGWRAGPGETRVDAWMITSPVGSVWELVRDRAWTGSAALALPGHLWGAVVAGLVGLTIWGALWLLPPTERGPGRT